MKICDSCGKVGGEHTPFCKYQNRDPEMLDVHDTHKVMGNGKCMWCDRSDVPGLVMTCAKTPNAEKVEPEIFPIDSSHPMECTSEGVWRCETCGATDRETLDKPCSKVPENFNFAVVEVHPSHRVKWDDGKPVNCEECGVSDAVLLTEACPNASPVRSIAGPRKRFEPSRLRDPSHDISVQGVCKKCGHENAYFLSLPCPNISLALGVRLPESLVWAIYMWDHSPMIVSIHARPEEAINANSNNNSIFPWKLGTDFAEAVKAWEKRNSESEKKE